MQQPRWPTIIATFAPPPDKPVRARPASKPRVRRLPAFAQPAGISDEAKARFRRLAGLRDP